MTPALMCTSSAAAVGDGASHCTARTSVKSCMSRTVSAAIAASLEATNAEGGCGSCGAGTCTGAGGDGGRRAAAVAARSVAQRAALNLPSWSGDC